ncbi:MAG: hypothetical protein AAF560_21085 [Acidobacteriota bacterium]
MIFVSEITPDAEDVERVAVLEALKIAPYQGRERARIDEAARPRSGWH